MPSPGPDCLTAADPGSGACPPVVVNTLKKRADFLKAARAKRRATPGFVLQARARQSDEAGAELIRVGFTCSKKVGNAVTRNRAKRRLRAVARAVLPRAGHPGWDYVVIGRHGATVSRPMPQMIADLHQALAQIHKANP